MTVFVLMGVAGSGKTTVGQAVADHMRWAFIEGDEHHPPANIAAMSAGRALSDTDRRDWIDALVAAINALPEPHCAVACSALTAPVRAWLRAGLQQRVVFIHLRSSPQVLENRITTRAEHFMKADMLAGQMAALEPPVAAHVVDSDQPLSHVIDSVLRLIRAELEPTS